MKNYLIIILMLFSILQAKKAPNFSLKNGMGKKISSEKFKKSDDLILLFWNVCCSKEEAEIIDEICREKNLKLLLVSIDKGSNISKAENFKKMKNLKAELLFDKNASVYRKYRGSFTKPVFFIVNKESEIVYRYDGHADKRFYEKKIDEYIK